MATETWLPLVLGYLIPIGLFMLGWGGMEPVQARRAATQGVLALALATLAYFAVGFAFHLGGAAVVSDQPGLAGLDRLVGQRVDVGLYWGVIGLDGFFLTGDADTPDALVLFATYLPMVTSAVLLAVLSLSGRAQGWQTALVGLVVGAVAFPLAACWVWGGGWLASLGRTVYRGHGFVDYAGSGVVHLLGGTAALGGLVAAGRRRPAAEPAEMPPAHFPLLANLGVLLLTVGWLGWALGAPFHVSGALVDPGRVAVNGLLAAAGATLACLAYCWLALGHGDPLMVARGTAAGLVAASASAPFIPPWAAVVVGAVAGLLLPMGVYLVDHLLRLSDSTAAIATSVFGGLWGLLATALFADGRWGQGWNSVGVESYHEIIGQGVSGFAAAPGFVGDGPGQSIAQLAGLGAITLLGFLCGWLLLKLLGLGRRPIDTGMAAPDR